MVLVSLANDMGASWTHQASQFIKLAKLGGASRYVIFHDSVGTEGRRFRRELFAVVRDRERDRVRINVTCHV